MTEQVKRFINSIPETTEDISAMDNAAPYSTIKQTFVKQNTLSRKNGKLYGCFNADFSAACEETKVTSIQLSAIVYSQYANDCSDGSAIDIITYN